MQVGLLFISLLLPAWMKLVKALLGKGTQVNAVNQNGFSASKDRHEIAVMLLEGGANPDAKDPCEATAMHWAAAKGDLKRIHILLYYKASTNTLSL
jgi:26S proteasome non-ATPase regulatory subunit 10